METVEGPLESQIHWRTPCRSACVRMEDEPVTVNLPAVANSAVLVAAGAGSPYWKREEKKKKTRVSNFRMATTVPDWLNSYLIPCPMCMAGIDNFQHVPFHTYTDLQLSELASVTEAPLPLKSNQIPLSG